MLLEGLVLMTGAEVGKHLLKSATEVGGGAVKEYLKGFFKGKIEAIVDKNLQLELKAAMEKAIGEFMKLFVEELRHADVPDDDIDRYYVNRIESLITDKETIALLGRAFDPGFKGFDDVQIAQIREIWTVYFKYRLMFPAKFDWQLLLDDYETKVTVIRRADEKLRKILDSEALGSIDDGIKTLIPINQKTADIAEKIYEHLQSNAPIPIGFDLDGYRKSLQESYGDLKLGRLGNNNEHNIQLGKIFIEQNVREALPPDPSPDPNSDESERNRRQYLEKSAEPVLTVLRDENCQRAVLLGDPGSGKSSLLQYLALDWAEGKTERFPLLIELREYAHARSDACSDVQNFLDFLVRGDAADCNFDRHPLHEYLLHQPSLVMFDGLDEIFDSQLRESTIDRIAKFAKQYPNAKIVVTSRVVGYVPDRLRGVEFKHFTLQELDESQIQEFIDTWYKLAQGEKPKQEQLKQRLKDAIDRSPPIRILADNPLLLTLMAMLNQQGDLPTRRVDLYNGALQLLLHNWDITVKKLEEDPSLEAIEVWEKQEMLGKIAYEMQFKEGMAGNLLDSQRLKQILTGYLKEHDFPEYQKTAKRLIEQLRTRSFILCAYGADAYGFVHRTFLEYFCAKDFVLRLKQEQYSREQLRDDVFARYWQDETWHEVLKLICGLLEPEQAGYLVEFLMDREVDRADYLYLNFVFRDEKCADKEAFQHLQLAIECWAEVKSPESSTAKNLKKKLKGEIESQSKISLSHPAAKLLLDLIGKYYHKEPETLTWLKDIALNAQDEYVRQAAVESIGEYYHKEPETLTCLKDIALNAQDEYVRQAALRSIGEYYHKEPETLNCLQQIALNAQHEDIRSTAVESIGKYYHKEPETLNCLQQIALNDQDQWVRWLAVKSIVKYYHTERESLNCLQQVALNDQDEGVRSTAVESIVKYYHTERESLNCLQQVALNDQHEDVRSTAVESIGKYYHKEPETLTWLKDIALNNQHQGVRRAAVWSIGQYYHQEASTLPWLKDIALNDQHEDVRSTAVWSIGQYYHQEASTLPWLKDIALNDQHEDVRSTAVESIGKYYHKEPETLTWLKDITFNDRDGWVRWAAVISIGKYYHKEPETLTWLKDIALNDQNEWVRRAAVKSIAQYYIQDDIAFKLLCQIASQDPYRGENYFNPRKIALEAVVENYIDQPEVIELLRDRSTQEPDEELRIWAEEQLKNIG
jgi:HEAT repeat protein